MPRLMGVAAALLTLLISTPASAEEVKLSLYPQFSKGDDSVLMADTRLTDDESDSAHWARQPIVLKADKQVAGSSQNFISGDWFALLELSGGHFDFVSTPNARDGGGPYVQAQVQAMFKVAESDSDPNTGRRDVLYVGLTAIGNGSLYEERKAGNWESQGGFAGAGLSFTGAESDGLATKQEDGTIVLDNLGRYSWNFQVMVVFRHTNGKTRDDTFELDHDQAVGGYLAASFSTYATRKIVGDPVEYVLDDSRYGERRIYGYSAILPEISLNGYVFIPFNENRKDSLVGQTSKGASNLFGFFGGVIKLARVHHGSLFGIPVHSVFGAGANVRVQERLKRSGRDFDMKFDPGVRGQYELLVGDRFTLFGFGDFTRHEDSGRSTSRTFGLSAVFKF